MRNIVISSQNKGELYRGTVEFEESAIYHLIGEQLLKVADKLPDTVSVDLGEDSMTFKCGVRGHYTKNGVEMPSMYVTETWNSTWRIPRNEMYEDKYLTCVNPESNNYKFYWLRPDTNGVGATYGRIGSERGEAFGTKDLMTPYPLHMFWIRYFEKISKGYIDQTDVYLNYEKPEEVKPADKAEEEVKKVKVNEASRKLYDILRACSRQYVSERVAVDVDKITYAQYKKSRELLDDLKAKNGNADDLMKVDEFNKILTELLAVVPRKTRDVRLQLANRAKDYTSILDREENLVNAMQAVVGSVNVKTTDEESFEGMGIKVYPATDKQKEEVYKHLGDGLKGKVKNVYRVIHKAQKARFDKYLKDNNIHHVKELWHGSRTENWYSIILNSLSLTPNAAITGKMFGKGIYFAPSAQKSFGYTSCYGTYWAHGHSNSGYMGLFATAYGKPYDTSSALPHFDKSALHRTGKDCVHAHAGASLRNDEIIFYDENACLINYIVEFVA